MIEGDNGFMIEGDNGFGFMEKAVGMWKKMKRSINQPPEIQRTQITPVGRGRLLLEVKAGSGIIEIDATGLETQTVASIEVNGRNRRKITIRLTPDREDATR